MENLLPKEVPPAWMWPFEDELEQWFENVRVKRRVKHGLDPYDEDDEEEDFSGGMERNRTLLAPIPVRR
jgi:hypothetical protein